MDPYEEERQAGFVAPMDALLQFVRQAEREILEAQRCADPEECHRLYDGAMDLLFHALNLSGQVAHVLSRNGRIAFMWIDYKEKPPTYRWVGCNSDYSFRAGHELSQEVCEVVVENLLGEKER